MSDDQITIEINGQSVKADSGSMVIEVADKAGIRIPRFCYHGKLSVAANCRMCLVEVEKAPKPLPACATPVMDGMKVFTKSPRAIAAQKATMEFLLINHPLDCPICDQGGECELQDVAMGYGGDVSRYAESKRVVLDKDLGSLVSTDMTRCIHCTRCVRFGQEVAGIREMGATGRGEHTRIGTYIEQAVDSEMSGNIIDLCPVGALTAKPSRFSARAWELMQYPALATHDCMGSNSFVHTFRGEVIRTVPRDNENINECWLSDRDRFSYEGVNSDSRLTTPMIKTDGEWKETDWDTALEAATKGIQAAGSDLGVLVSPNSTLEEMSLLQQIAKGQGSVNIDHRLRQIDFRDQENAPVYPSLGQTIEQLEKIDAALVIGSNVRKEQPIAAHRLRKASLRGAKLMFMNTRDFDFHFEVAESIVATPAQLVSDLAAIAKSVMDITESKIPAHLSHVLANARGSDVHLAIAEHLKAAESATVILGSQAMMMPCLADLRLLAICIAQATGASFGYLTDGANSSGAWLAGNVPHRDLAGASSETQGKTVSQMLSDGQKAFLLSGIEPDLDVADSAQCVSTLDKADCVVALTAFASETLKSCVDILLPIAASLETSGTYINIEGKSQSVKGVAPAKGESRPGWKVLRVLGNLLDLSGFDYISSEEIRDELMAKVAQVEMNNLIESNHEAALPALIEGITRLGAVASYHEDAQVRRAASLQKTADGKDTQLRINPEMIKRLGLGSADKVIVSQAGNSCSMTFVADSGIPDDCVWLPVGTADSATLGPLFSSISVEAD